MADRVNDTAKKDTLLSSVNALKIFFCVFMFFTASVLVYYFLADDSLALQSEKVVYIDHWIVKDHEGKIFTTGRYFRDNHYYDGPYTIETTLPADIKDDTFLCFTLNGDTDIYIDSELRYSFMSERDVPLPGGQVKRFYITVPLSSADSAKLVTMVKNSFSRHPEVVPETFIAGIGGMYNELFSKYGVSFSISAVLLIFSFVVIVIAIVLRIWYRQSIGMLYGAAGIFVIAGWLITNSFLFPFIFKHYHVDGVLNYMLCLMMPFGLVLYIDSVQNGRYRKWLMILLLISAIDAVVWTVLHFTGILPFYNALLYIDIILGILMTVAVCILFVDSARGNTREYLYTFIGFIGFFVFCFIQIIALTVLTLKQDDLPMLAGLTFLLTFVVLQQVEDMRRMNYEKQRAIDLSDAKTKFLASMSHEIRTPINSILGMNEMILRENKDEMIGEYAQTVRSSGKMLLMLVNDVLDFSKIEAGKLEITNVEYRLSRLLSDVLIMMNERAHAKNLEIITKITGEVPDGQIGDEIRIKQILVNLISNAVKYTDRGRITLSVHGKDMDESAAASKEYGSSGHRYALCLDVEDTGRGIKPEETGDLFNAFSRADIKKNRNIEGTGLGLAIVKSIIDSMGGTIEVKSEYGKGSCFSVMIPVEVFDSTPLREDFAEAHFTPEEKYRIGFTAPDARILAVDDNQSNLTIVRLFLKETGIKIDLCSNGTEAIRLCKTNKYDLILLDHMMPAPDGIETLKAIRSDDKALNASTPAVVLTANAVAGSRQIYMEAGFDDYLTKPLDSRTLENTVKEYLPKDKIILGAAGADAGRNVSSGVKEVPGKNSPDTEAEGDRGSTLSLEDRLSFITGMDYASALEHCAGQDSILEEVLNGIVDESGERIARMRKNLEDKNYEAYCIDAHAIKGLMATVGLAGLSETAKKHEFAARDNDIPFIEENVDAFIKEYEDICAKIKAMLG